MGVPPLSINLGGVGAMIITDDISMGYCPTPTCTRSIEPAIGKKNIGAGVGVSDPLTAFRNLPTLALLKTPVTSETNFPA